MNKKPIIVLAGIGLVLLLGFACLPLLVSKDYIKSQVAGSFKSFTGLSLDIQGDIDVGSFPLPHVIIHSLDVHNIPGAESPFMMVIKSLNIRPSFLSMLTGKFSFDAVTASGVELRLERLDADHVNWKLPASSNEQALITIPSISSLIITDGVVHYTNTPTKSSTEIAITNLNLSNSHSRNGISMDLRYADKSLSAKGYIGNIGEGVVSGSLPINIAVASGKTALTYEGEIGVKNTNLFVKGNLSLNADDVAPWVSLLNDTESVKSIAAVKSTTVPLPVQVTADIDTNTDKITLSNVALSGPIVNGKAEIAITDLSSVDVKATIDSLDLESIFSSKIFDTKKIAAVSDKKDEIVERTFEKPKAILGSVSLASDITIADMVYNSQHIKDAHLAFDVKDEEVTISKANCLFPGESRVVFVGFGKQGYQSFEFDGQIEAAGDDFMQMISVFKTKGFALPPEDFKRFRFRTNAVISGHDMRFSEIAARIENIAFVGGMVVTLNDRPEIRTSLNVFGVNLDHFIALWGLQAWQDAMLKDTLVPQTEALLPQWLKSFGYDLKLNAALEKYVLDGKTLDKSDLSLQANAGTIAVSNFRTSYNGSQFMGDIAVSVLEPLPRVDIDIVADTVDVDALLGNEKKDPKVTQVKKSAETAKISKTADRLSTDGFNFHWLDIMNGTYHFKIGHFKDGMFEVDNVDTKGSLSDGKLSVDQILFNILGAAFGGKGTLKGGKIPAVTMDGWLRGIEIGNLYEYLPSFQGLTGKYNVSLQLNTSGNNILTWVSNVWGAVGIGGRDLVVRGLNMPGIIHAVAYVRNVADILNVVKRAFPGGNTVFSTVEGQWTVSNGKIKLSNTVLTNDETKGTLDGDVDLVNWKIESQVSFDLKSLDANHPPSVMVNMTGDLDNPDKSLDTHLLEQYVTDKTSEKMLQEYGAH